MENNIVISTESGIMKIRINRPEKKNAFTQAMYGALADGIMEAESDKSVRALYITGTGNVFTSGNDIMDFMQKPDLSDASPFPRFLRGLSSCEKPVVGAVNGIAVGVGVTMLLHMDLVYAGSGARFHLPFVNLGLVPEAGSSYLLPKTAGIRRAAELLMLGEPIDSPKALDYGIINGIFPDDELEKEAWGRAVALAEKPPEALRLTKALLKKSHMGPLEDAVKEEMEFFLSRLSSPEAAEAFKAFMEKRKPDFSKV